ncbi:hypothetical protein RB195_020781 [Necator americanus]
MEWWYGTGTTPTSDTTTTTTTKEGPIEEFFTVDTERNENTEADVNVEQTMEKAFTTEEPIEPISITEQSNPPSQESTAPDPDCKCD